MILLLLWFGILWQTVSCASAPLIWKWKKNVDLSNRQRITILCHAFSQFNKKQIKLCVKYPDLMEHILTGAKTAVQECGRQLSSNRWNCSNVPPEGSLFGPVLTEGCRESAFLYAITSAGVAHAITTACSQGTYTSCGCDMSRRYRPQDGWEWNGCHSNVRFGTSLTKQFANARDTRRGSDQRKKMNRHNIRVGVKALKKLTLRKCKCHGVCGSCDLKTCWMQHPRQFEIIAEYLKKRYKKAVEMRTMIKTGENDKKDKSGELVYYQSSPNFCDANKKYATPGTSGRICNLTSSDIDSCDLLCCGRGYDVQIVTKTVKCNCEFIWCCHVKCDTCSETQQIYTCK